jgi:DNA mismatch repair protein MutL
VGPTVRLLDDTLVDQIAAGEVIERPANLVKELLENAIDAGATAITVAVEDGGRSHVRVSDDGTGMSPEDARLSIERHATSKIATFEDLLAVRTLGFRGEALPSIGSVARMTITTRPKASLEGTRVIVEGGALQEITPVGCPPGTSVEVADLFFNVPARRKFLRARQSETARVFEVCQRIALSHPELRLIVYSDGRRARQYLPAKDLAERARQVFRAVPLEPILAERDGIRIEGVLAPAELARPGARHLFLLVNGRPIVDRGLARAIAFAHGDRLPPGRYPRGVVSIELPPQDVDVNAHPQKTEVRFRHTAQLLDRVTRMVSAHLPGAPSGDRYWDSRIDKNRTGIERKGEAAPRVAQSETEYEVRPPNGLRLIAEVRHELLLCEGEDELIVLDRARADTIRRLDLLRASLDSERSPRQSLLFPDRVQLSTRLEQTLERHASTLSSVGFEWSELGPGSYVVRSVPTPVADLRGSRSLVAALKALSNERGEEEREAVLRALAKAAAAQPGSVLQPGDAARITSAIWTSRQAHESCVVARIPLSSTERCDG